MKTVDLIQRDALIYQRYKCMLDVISPDEIALFRKEVELAYNRIIFGGLKIEYVGYDPYKTLDQLTDDVVNSRLLRVSRLNNVSELLGDELNLKFRAVHDYLHYLFQQPFGYKGERNVYKTQKFFHSTDIGKRILYSEVVLQAAYAEYYGRFPDKQKVII